MLFFLSVLTDKQNLKSGQSKIRKEENFLEALTLVLFSESD